MNSLNLIELEAFLASHGCTNWWPEDATDPASIPEVAGRVCYMSFNSPRPGGNQAYIDHIIASGHHSVLEHATFGFMVEGVSRSLTHEFVRHRVGMSYSQLSQRYVDESDVAFVVPPALICDVQNNTPTGVAWRKHMEKCLEVYGEVIRGMAGSEISWTRKQIREASRSVLPNATETKLFVTGNARSWRHFISLRMSPHADAEIQRLASDVFQVLCDVSPNLFEDLYVSSGDETA